MIITTKNVELMEIKEGACISISAGTTLEVTRNVDNRIVEFSYKGYSFKELIVNEYCGLELIKEDKGAVKMDIQLLANKEERQVITVTNSNYTTIDFEGAIIAPHDADAVRDAVLCMVNDREVYNQIKATNKSLAVKLKKDTFDYNKAVKGFYNIVNNWLLNNEYGYTKEVLTVHDRYLIAAELLENNLDTIEEYSNYMTTTEVKTAWKTYKNHLIEVAPDLFKDKIALNTEFTMWVDMLDKSNKLSNEHSSGMYLDDKFNIKL